MDRKYALLTGVALKTGGIDMGNIVLFKKTCGFLFLGILIFSLVGCSTVRTRQVVKERVDQDLSWGNRGYLSGSLPPQEDKDRKKTRKTYEIEVELANPFKSEKPSSRKIQDDKSKNQPAAAEERIEEMRMMEEEDIYEKDEADVMSFKEYTVEKNDTLQKISQKFYGTTKKWKKIYDANTDTLKSPDKVYPGQKLNIPQD